MQTDQSICFLELIHFNGRRIRLDSVLFAANTMKLNTAPYSPLIGPRIKPALGSWARLHMQAKRG